jgi:hypothetical protein
MAYSGNGFDAFIAIDFSGSKHSYLQKKHIVFAETEHKLASTAIKSGFTRFTVILHLMERLQYHTKKRNRVLLGFDFCYSFPRGLWYSLTNTREVWGAMIKGMAEGFSGLPPIIEEPLSNARLWAELANKKITQSLNCPSGPFWGANFIQARNPKFFGRSDLPFSEYRIVEKRLPRCKSVFKIGGQGSVGLQSLCGMPLLARLQSLCLQEGTPLHAWPFEGWDFEKKNVLVEWYPAIYNINRKSDENDAIACVEWAKSADAQGSLTRYFHPDLSATEKAQAEFEGWILGVA